MPYPGNGIAIVARSAEAGPTLHLRRTFDAPRALLWRAWSRPDSLVAWMGPADWPAFSVTSDFRIGGVWRIGLKSSETGEERWQRGVYREIAEPERLTYSFGWEDDREGDASVDSLITVEFGELEAGRTVVDLTHAQLKSQKSLAHHQHSWASSVDRLAAWLAADDNAG